MFQTCLRRRLRVACNRRGFDCAYVAERILVELPIRAVRRRVRLRHSAASHRRCDFKLTACAMFYVASGECHRQQHWLGGFCAAASRSDRARPGGPSYSLHLRPRPGVLDGLHAAATRRFLLSLRLLRRASCRRPLRLGLCMRESVHHRLAIQSDGAAGCSSPALQASHRRRGSEPSGLRHTTASGLCRQQQHCLGGLSAGGDSIRLGPAG